MIEAPTIEVEEEVVTGAEEEVVMEEEVDEEGVMEEGVDEEGVEAAMQDVAVAVGVVEGIALQLAQVEVDPGLPNFSPCAV